MSENRPNGSNRRKFSSHFIKGDLKLRLVLDDMLFALCASLLSIGLLYYLSNKEIGDSMFSAHLSLKETRELLHRGVFIAGGVTFVAVLLFGTWSMIDAHRLAGPIHRLTRLLKEIGEGNLTHEIAFRRRDEFQEVATAADTMVESLARKITNVSQKVDALDNKLANNAKISDTTLQDIIQDVKSVQAELAAFQLPGPDASPTIDGRSLNS